MHNLYFRDVKCTWCLSTTAGADVNSVSFGTLHVTASKCSASLLCEQTRIIEFVHDITDCLYVSAQAQLSALLICWTAQQYSNRNALGVGKRCVYTITIQLLLQWCCLCSIIESEAAQVCTCICIQSSYIDKTTLYISMTLPAQQCDTAAAQRVLYHNLEQQVWLSTALNIATCERATLHLARIHAVVC
jgi:hypothetical protein